MKKKTFTLNSDTSRIIILVLLGINLLLALYIAFFKKDALWLETLKVGGKENFTLIEKLYNNPAFKDQQAQTLNQILGSIGGEPTNDETPVGQVLDQMTIEKLLKDTYVKGNKNARFIILEYSDLLCPFCKRHYEAQTLEKLVEKYPSDVALVFKNMPLVQLHPTAFKGAEAVECAGKLGGQTAFYKYLDKAFKESVFDDTNVVTLAKNIGLNTSSFTSCINNQEFKSKIDGILQEASTTFGINGTPGNVIIDKETGKYTIINGAYPFEEFDTKLQAMMK